MNTEQLDLLQFHWLIYFKTIFYYNFALPSILTTFENYLYDIRWDYSDKHYFDTMGHLMGAQQDGMIKHLGLTNFDTKHMLDLVEEGAPIVSNQVHACHVI